MRRSFEGIAEAQGWDEASQLLVLRNYVTNQQSEDALSDYAEGVAAEENDGLDERDAMPVLNAIIESVEFDANTAEDVGGTGVFVENSIVRKDNTSFVLQGTDGHTYTVTVERS